MKHLLLLLLLSLSLYFGWRYASRADRKAVRKFMAAHLPWVVIIVAVILAALVSLYSSGSIHLL